MTVYLKASLAQIVKNQSKKRSMSANDMIFEFYQVWRDYNLNRLVKENETLPDSEKMNVNDLLRSLE